MKLLDFLNKVMYKGTESAPSDFNEGQSKAFEASANKLAKAAQTLKEIEANIDSLNKELLEAKNNYHKAVVAGDKAAKIQFAAEIQSITKRTKAKEDHFSTENKKYFKELDEIKKKFKLSADDINAISDHVTQHSHNLSTAAIKSRKSLDILNVIAKNGFEGILSNSKAFSMEFEVLNELINVARHQIMELNKVMVQFNREMGQGFSNNMLGMDLYGSSERGSIQSFGDINAVEIKDILGSLKSLSKGRTMGSTENFEGQQEAMTSFAIKSAQLSKFYGVHLETINGITSNLVYNFGAKIKDLNGIFARGKEVALAAGISVNEYFERLKEATDQLGEHYIANGIQGLEGLAAYAAKTNQSVSEIMKSADRFKNYTTLWQEQNLAAAHSMNETAKNTAKIWALKTTGDVAGMDKLYKGSIAKDIMNNGMVDKNNNISAVGLQNLQQMGMQKDEIQAIQRIIKLQKEAGITMEQWLDPMHQSLDVQKKINRFEQDNLTIGEKLKQLWGKLKVSFIDPIASILGPLIDGILSVAGIIVDILSPIFKAITWPLQMFGKLLGKVAGVLQDFELGISKVVNFLNPFKNKDGDDQSLTNNRFAKGVGALLGAIMVGNILNRAGISGRGVIGSIGNAVRGGNLLNTARFNAGVGISMGRNMLGRSSTVQNLRAAAGTGFGSGLLSAFKGALIGVAGSYLGNKVGGEAGKNISTIASFAGMGSMFGPIGTAVGAAVGIINASWGKISTIWEDNSKSLWEAIAQTTTETFEGAADSINDWAHDKRESNIIAGLMDKYNKLVDPEWYNDKYKDNAAVQDMINNNTYTDTKAQVNKIINSRNVAIPMAAESAHEKRMNQQFTPNVHVQVNTTFDKDAKARIMNRGTGA